MPILLYAIRNVADSAARTRSHEIARLKPPPAAAPCTAAITGASSRAKRETARCRIRSDLAQIALQTVLRREDLHVAAKTKITGQAAQQNRANIAVALAAQRDLHQLFGHLQVKSITRLRTIQGDISNVVAYFK